MLCFALFLFVRVNFGKINFELVDKIISPRIIIIVIVNNDYSIYLIDTLPVSYININIDSLAHLNTIYFFSSTRLYIIYYIYIFIVFFFINIVRSISKKGMMMIIDQSFRARFHVWGACAYAYCTKLLEHE